MAKVLLNNAKSVQITGGSSQTILIQNRSSGNVFMAYDDDESIEDSGFVIEAKGVYEILSGGYATIWLRGGTPNAEVRILGGKVLEEDS